MPEEIVKVKDTVRPVSSGGHVFIVDGATTMKTVDGNFGETMLDRFAGHALQGVVAANSKILQRGVFISSEDINEHDAKRELAEFCYDMAEFMMDERKKREASK